MKGWIHKHINVGELHIERCAQIHFLQISSTLTLHTICGKGIIEVEPSDSDQLKRRRIIGQSVVNNPEGLVIDTRSLRFKVAYLSYIDKNKFCRHFFCTCDVCLWLAYIPCYVPLTGMQCLTEYVRKTEEGQWHSLPEILCRILWVHLQNVPSCYCLMTNNRIPSRLWLPRRPPWCTCGCIDCIIVSFKLYTQIIVCMLSTLCYETKFVKKKVSKRNDRRRRIIGHFLMYKSC